MSLTPHDSLVTDSSKVDEIDKFKLYLLWENSADKVYIFSPYELPPQIGVCELTLDFSEITLTPSTKT